MKFTLAWLKDHLETDAPLDEILDTLTMIGLEVEHVADPAAALAGYVVAEVVSAEKHPDADKLQVCRVATGKEELQVVCGAPNARAGMKGVFAPAGAYVPGIDLTLKKVKIRGVESNGMLCSERELELSDEHTGIIELSDQAEVGSPAADALGLTDPVIDIAITPNRPDCLGVRGVARDLAAAGLGTLKDDTVKAVEGGFESPIGIELRFEAGDAEACPVFAGRLVKNIKNGPSPAWLQQRLKAIGLRPINALVDITNYVSYDRGRPLHVYDADKLSGAVSARLGKKGESFLALDGNEYEVNEQMCVIADDAQVLGLGGVMGGEATGCTEATKNVLIESAYFSPLRTAATGRSLNILSDARYRFERGVDPAFVLPGLEMASAMVLELCGGEVSKPTVAGAPPEAERVIEFDLSEVARLTGLELGEKRIKKVLGALGFWLSGHGPTFKVAVPPWRPDVGQAADLVEEVMRIVGVDQVKATAMSRVSGIARPVLTPLQKRVRRGRRALAGRGLVEAVTWSFIPRKEAKRFAGGGDELELANPISTEMSSMRPSLLPGLVSAVQRNHDRGHRDCALFEMGQAYRGAQPQDQYTAAAGVRAGSARLEGAGRDWSGEAKPADLYDAKADALSLLAALGVDAKQVQINRQAPDWYHPGRSGVLQLGPKVVLGTFGELHPATLRAFGVDGGVAAFEIDLNSLPQARRKTTSRGPLVHSDLLPVTRDFAFLLDQAVAAGDVVRAAAGADKALISDVSVFDVFEGQGVAEGKKSLAIEVTLQPREKTLTDNEIEVVADKVVAAVVKATDGELRG
jgi:phenylalanyl-tRNA synthetase beta chain